MKVYIQQIGRFLLLLLALQTGRGLIITGLWRFLQPALDSPIWAMMDMLAFGLIVGLPRWWTGRIYGSRILHSLVNIFGR